jgi:hypothetical protein
MKIFDSSSFHRRSVKPIYLPQRRTRVVLQVQLGHWWSG